MTLDLDFANPLVFDPKRYAGIVVLRIAKPITLASIHDSIHRFIQQIDSETVQGRLWIVDEHRVRVYQPEASR